jgi:hypothetical protein
MNSDPLDRPVKKRKVTLLVDEEAMDLIPLVKNILERNPSALLIAACRNDSEMSKPSLIYFQGHYLLMAGLLHELAACVNLRLQAIFKGRAQVAKDEEENGFNPEDIPDEF